MLGVCVPSVGSLSGVSGIDSVSELEVSSVSVVGSCRNWFWRCAIGLRRIGGGSWSAV